MSKDTVQDTAIHHPKRKKLVLWIKIFLLIFLCWFLVSFYKQFTKTPEERGLDLYKKNSAQWEEMVRQAKPDPDGLKFVRVYEQVMYPEVFLWVVYDESDEIINSSKFQYKYWTYELRDGSRGYNYETTHPLNVARIKGHYYYVDRNMYQQGYKIVRSGEGYEIQKSVCSSIKYPVEEDCIDFQRIKSTPIGGR